MRSLLLVVLLAGCASQPLVFSKPGGTQEQFEADKNFCAYEALKAVQTTDPRMGGMLGDELDKGIRRNEIGMACMRMKGYTSSR